MNEMVIIGKSISTHGIKGELKIISDFEYKDKAFKIGNRILINNVEHIISSIRYHKNYILMSIDNLSNINDVLQYVGYNIYLSRKDLCLSENEYLLKDLIGMEVYDNDALIGVVEEILLGNINNYIKVKSNKEFLIPLIPEYINKVDIKTKKIITKNATNLII